MTSSHIGTSGSKTNNSSKKLAYLAGQSEEIIFCTATFRFRLERYEMLIDRAKITVIRRLFLLADNITSIGWGDVLSVDLSVGPFFGSLTLKARYIERPVIVGPLRRDKAFKAKRLIEGLIVACSRGITLDEIPTDELLEEIIQIGTGAR